MWWKYFRNFQDNSDFNCFNLVLRLKLERKTSGADNTGLAELYCYISSCVVHVSGMRVHYCSSLKKIMGGVFGIFFANNGTLYLFYTSSMDFCPEAGMVSGISQQNGTVALKISVRLGPMDHEPIAAALITRATLPNYFQVLATNIL